MQFIDWLLTGTLPGMWERTITIGSAGKAFSVTGWKLGWAYGPENLIKNLQIVHQNCVGTCPTHTQEATAIAIEHELGRLNSSESFFRNLAVELEGKRDYITNTLKSSKNAMKCENIKITSCR